MTTAESELIAEANKVNGRCGIPTINMEVV
jgi:hypothetical protein